MAIVGGGPAGLSAAYFLRLSGHAVTVYEREDRIGGRLRHAFDEAGSGWGATFRRDFPIFHIDHTLLGDEIEAVDYRLIDPGIGRHRAQVIELVR